MSNSSIKTYLKETNFISSKKMGQNFLINQDIIDKIISNIPPIDKYDIILEIGPGLGSLTDELIKLNKKIIAVELDKRLFAHLKDKYQHNGIELINDDFLDIDLTKMLSEYKNVIVVANIPYSITSPIITMCMKQEKIMSLYIMVQKEVALKFDYSKNTNRNAFTNFVAYYYDAKYCFTIKSGCFQPAPKVDSAMMLFNKKSDKPYNQDFFDFLKLIFLNKRKKLLNAIANGQFKNIMSQILLKLNYSTNIRAEELSYIELYNIYLEYKKEIEHENC